MGKKKFQYFDYSLLTIVIFLVCFGLVMLYSTSFYGAQIKFGDGMYFFKRQAIISAVSIVGMMIVSKIDYHKYAHFAKIAYWISFTAPRRVSLLLVPSSSTVNL